MIFYRKPNKQNEKGGQNNGYPVYSTMWVSGNV